MKQISLLGILIGGIFDIFMSGIVGMAVVLVLTFSGWIPGQGATDVQGRVAEIMSAPAAIVATFVTGGLVSIAAGYIAASIAKRAELLNGALSSIFCVLQGLYFIAAGGTDHSVGYWAAEFILPPLLGLSGGYLKQRRLVPRTS